MYDADDTRVSGSVLELKKKIIFVSAFFFLGPNSTTYNLH